VGSNGKRKGEGGDDGEGAEAPAASEGGDGSKNGASKKAADEAEARTEGAAEASAPSEAGQTGDGGGDQKPPPSGGAPKGKPWGEPFFRFEKKWTWLELRLLTFVLLAEIGVLVAWVLLRGLSEPVDKAAANAVVAGSAAVVEKCLEAGSSSVSGGTTFRGVLGALAFGLTAWLGTGKIKGGLALGVRRAITIGAIGLGVAVTPLWRGAFVEFFDNFKGWLQEGSFLTLMGGLRGVATRLTLWVALLGGSLATGAGKHIHIDVIFRFLPTRFRLPAAVTNYCAAAVVCFAGVWGFFDHIAIEDYGSKKDDTAGQKIEHALHEMGEHFFLARKQIGLDLRSLPHVLGGKRYDQWMTGRAWNEWVDGAGFAARYTAEQVQTIKVPDDTPTHSPLVVSPLGNTTRGMLVHTLGLVFPFGLLAIGLRFLLRAILSLSGHFSVDPNEAHKEDLGRSAEEAV
jgi:hypothetical protein